MQIALPLSDALLTVFLVGARLAGLVVSAPVFSSPLIPGMLKAGLVVLLSLTIAATLPAMGAMSGLAFGLGLVFQFTVGVMLGLVLSVFLSIFGMAGQIITYQLGVGLAVEADPALLSGGSFLAEWETLIATFFFVAAGGLELTVQALNASFTALPISVHVLPTSALAFLEGLFQTALTMLILVAAPMLLAGLVVNFSVGVISRAIPQLNAFFMAMPLGFGVGLLVLTASLPLLFQMIPTIWQRAFEDLSHLLVLLGGKP